MHSSALFLQAAGWLSSHPPVPPSSPLARRFSFRNKMTARNKLPTVPFLTDFFCPRYVLLIIPLHTNKLEPGWWRGGHRQNHGKTPHPDEVMDSPARGLGVMSTRLCSWSRDTRRKRLCLSIFQMRPWRAIRERARPGWTQFWKRGAASCLWDGVGAF